MSHKILPSLTRPGDSDDEEKTSATSRKFMKKFNKTKDIPSSDKAPDGEGEEGNEEEDEGEDEEAMMELMGFSGFGTTKVRIDVSFLQPNFTLWHSY